MDTVFPPLTATRFDAVTSAVSAAVYLLVGFAALLRAPRDARTGVFLLVAVTGLGPYLLPVYAWLRPGSTFTKPLVSVLAVSLVLGSLALFHFTQIFPWRRPWIRRYFELLLTGYGLGPLIVLGLIWFAPRHAEDIEASYAVLTVFIGLPAIFVAGIVLPFAGLLSLYYSVLAARAAGFEQARRPLMGILVSQLAGGVLAILIIPLLHFVAPAGALVTIASALLFGFGLLMPIAFAAGVWRFRVLDLDIEGLPSVRAGSTSS
ncbi:MAG: hypothetical protein DMF84_04060 [Acidobacteria bacterium]|nr:MAG: hypothetical protein DMF84_04060 [Acidobacteriota bacterium]